MARYRIVCTDQEPIDQPTTHAHIVSVGTGTDPDKADRKWTLREVIDAIESRQHSFYTQGVKTGKVAEVIVAGCKQCGSKIIRSAPDAVEDNNLDSLRRCSWRS